MVFVQSMVKQIVFTLNKNWKSLVKSTVMERVGAEIVATMTM